MIRDSVLNQPIVNIGNDPDKIKVLPIQECNEPLVEVQEEAGIFISPQYVERGISSALDKIFVRAGVLDALRVAVKLLPKNMGLLLWDGLRTLETQKELFEQAKLDLLIKNDNVELYLAAPPLSKSAFQEFPPPHTTGGAIDVTLCDDRGEPLDLGADFDEFRKNAWLVYFEKNRIKEYGKVARQYRIYRRILYWVMLNAGFSPYPWEFWHYELGTIVAANFHGFSSAKYGAMTSW